jgi:hypothetical protein
VCVWDIERPSETECLWEKYVTQPVSGRKYRTWQQDGVERIIGSFVIDKLPNNIRIMVEKLWDVTMQLTYMEEEGTEILVENIQK